MNPKKKQVLLMELDIRHIARLARLRLDEGEAETLSAQMEQIMEMVSSIPALDGDNADIAPADPMALRDDEMIPPTPREEILANAPQQEAGCFVVPRFV